MESRSERKPSSRHALSYNLTSRRTILLQESLQGSSMNVTRAGVAGSSWTRVRLAGAAFQAD